MIVPISAHVAAIASSLLLAFCSSSIAEGAVGGVQANAPIRIETGADLVLVPVTVRDRDGRVVEDLTIESFQVFDRGKRQEITSFSVEKPGGRLVVDRSEDGSLRTRTIDVPEHFTAYLFDDLSIRETSDLTRLRDAVVRQMPALQPGDRIGVFSTSCRIGLDFTNDSEKLRVITSRLEFRPVPVCRAPKNQAVQFALLKALMKRMAALPGERRIIIVSPGFSISPPQSYEQDDSRALLTELIDLASRSRVRIDAVHMNDIAAGVLNDPDPRRSDTFSSRSIPAATSQSMEELVQGTGGTFVASGNNYEQAFRQVATPESVYVLGFVPRDSKRDGRFHTLRVTIQDQRKLRLQARRGYYAPKRDAEPVGLGAESRSDPDFAQGEMQATTGKTAMPLQIAPSGTVPVPQHLEAEAASTLAASPASAQPPSRLPSASEAVVIAEPVNLPEIAQIEQPVTFSATSNLVMVPVVVRDRQGHAVGHLTKADFLLFDENKQQEIRSFSLAMARGPAEESQRPIAREKTSPQDPLSESDHFIAYVFDDSRLRFENLAQTREAAWRVISEKLQPTDLVAIFTTSGLVSIDFTSDHQGIREALFRMRPEPVNRVCPDLSCYLAYQVDKGDAVAKGVAGRRIQKCSPNPTDMQTEVIAARVAAECTNSSRSVLMLLKSLVRRMTTLRGARTIILVSPGFVASDDLRRDETELMEQAVRSRVIINTLDALGVWAFGPGGSMEQPQYDPRGSSDQDARYDRAERYAGAQAISALADGAGGVAIENSNDFTGAFRRLTAVPEYVYVLGFSPQALKSDGTFHPLRVQLAKARDLTVQARSGYYAPAHSGDAREAAKQEIETAVFSRDEVRNLPVELRTRVVKVGDDAAAKLEVQATIDVRGLRFGQADGRNRNDVTFVSALFDQDGNFIAGVQQVLQLRLRDKTIAKLDQTSPLAVKTDFDVKQGNYLVRMIVRDAEGQLLTAESDAVEVP